MLFQTCFANKKVQAVGSPVEMEIGMKDGRDATDEFMGESSEDLGSSSDGFASEPLRFLGHAGEPIDDLMRCSTTKNPLDALQLSLESDLIY
jgi:hypothetical protein